MKKKIYSISFHYVLNYGAVLQAYALNKYLIEQGFDAEIIDYRPLHFIFKMYRPTKILSANFEKIKKNIRFHKFRRKYLKLTPKIYYSHNTLKKFPTEAVYICGSDQIWNPLLTNNKYDFTYFLDFVPKGSKRVSYAASLGGITFRRENLHRIKSALSKFNVITVREDFAYNQVLNLDIGSKPIIAIDPTFLLDSYSELILPIKKLAAHKYIVSYNTETAEQHFSSYIEKIKAKLGLPLINIGNKYEPLADENLLSLSPEEWLTYIKHSSFVCTNSFHATAFALIFNKNFCVIGRKTHRNLNRRQELLLENLDLKCKMVHEEFDNILEPIDYNLVKPKLDSMIDKSKNLLNLIFTGE